MNYFANNNARIYEGSYFFILLSAKLYRAA